MNWEDKVKKIVGFDPECDAYSNLQHVLHFFEGYRAAVLDPSGEEEENPYSPGGAQHFSWEQGHQQAEQDIKKKGEDDERTRASSR